MFNQIDKKPESANRKEFIQKLTLLSMGIFLTGFSSEEKEDNPRIKILIEKALNCLKNNNFLDSPFLIGSFYFTKNYFDNLEHKDILEKNEIILNEINKNITEEKRKIFLSYLKNLCLELDNYSKNSKPLDVFKLGQDHQYAHKDAIDIFLPPNEKISEQPVFSITSGLVILTENNWQINDKLSTISPKGGNTVIIFEPSTEKFFRYAHLKKSLIKTGDIVASGQEIGTLGQTGENAIKLPKKETHLHLEINYLDKKGYQTATNSVELRGLLDNIK